MRDPDLVHRAERAASALERAWDRWRTMHGLGSEPAPPVSSYVGYSMEEPWGQPRVVFGVDALEAERLAALLDGHDCFGPVHAEVAGRPDWRRSRAGDIGAPARPIDDHLSIPAQAPPPAADMIGSAWPADGAPDLDGHVFEPDALRQSTPEPDAPPTPAGEAEIASEALEVTPQELAPLPPMPDPSPAGPLGSASLAPRRVRDNDVMPSERSGYREARYQGVPARFRTTKQPAKPPSAESAGAELSNASSASEASAAASAKQASAAGPASEPSSASSASEASAAASAKQANAAPVSELSSASSASQPGAPAPASEQSSTASASEVSSAAPASQPSAAAPASAATPKPHGGAPTPKPDNTPSATEPNGAASAPKPGSAAPKPGSATSPSASKATRVGPAAISKLSGTASVARPSSASSAPGSSSSGVRTASAPASKPRSPSSASASKPARAKPRPAPKTAGIRQQETAAPEAPESEGEQAN